MYKYLNVPLGVSLVSQQRKNIDPLVGGAIITGVSGLLGSLFGASSQSSANAANLQAVRETNEANKQLYLLQHENAINDWKMQNAYNDPAAMRSRYEAAGFNPSLMMQNSANAGSAQAISQPSANPMQAGQVSPIDYSSFGHSVEAAVNAYLQGQSLQADAQLKRSQANLNNIDAQTKNALNLAQLKSMAQNTHLSVWQRRLAQQQYNFLAKANTYRLAAESYAPDVSKAQLASIQQQTSLQKAQEASIKLHDMLDKVMSKKQLSVLDSQMAKARAEIGLIASQKNLTDNQAKTEVERLANQVLQNTGLRQSNTYFAAAKDIMLESLDFELESTRLNVKQQKSDYDNPFKYIGGLLGSPAANAAVTRNMLKFGL